MFILLLQIAHATTCPEGQTAAGPNSDCATEAKPMQKMPSGVAILAIILATLCVLSFVWNMRRSLRGEPWHYDTSKLTCGASQQPSNAVLYPKDLGRETSTALGYKSPNETTTKQDIRCSMIEIGLSSPNLEDGKPRIAWANIELESANKNSAGFELGSREDMDIHKQIAEDYKREMALSSIKEDDQKATNAPSVLESVLKEEPPRSSFGRSSLFAPLSEFTMIGRTVTRTSDWTSVSLAVQDSVGSKDSLGTSSERYSTRSNPLSPNTHLLGRASMLTNESQSPARPFERSVTVFNDSLAPAGPFGRSSMLTNESQSPARAFGRSSTVFNDSMAPAGPFGRSSMLTNESQSPARLSLVMKDSASGEEPVMRLHTPYPGVPRNSLSLAVATPFSITPRTPVGRPSMPMIDEMSTHLVMVQERQKSVELLLEDEESDLNLNSELSQVLYNQVGF